MAQAARLNLRMQKEIKLLLNDPPHGVSLNLSEDQSALSSLSSIEARIGGPGGTVYSKGVFVLKIQIPERYPFQPPNVTFVTPIYHPNIDNGGRICLDILNLPPKGAWQPSLNIATILTSIGLLLSEPNPDDGLMAEISREYKYNRQVFDINARSWTEKYANPATISANGWSSVDDSILAQNTQMEEIQNLESLPKASNKECEGSRKKMRLLGQKLSLKSEGSEENTTTGKQDLVANHLPSTARSTDPTACSSDVSSKQNASLENMSVSADSGVVLKKEYQGNGKNLKLLGQRLSATPEAPSKRSNGNVEDKLPNHLPTSTSNTKDPGMQSSNDVLENSMTKSIDRSSDSLYKVSEGNNTNVRSLGQKMSLTLVKPENESNDQKENMAPNHLPSLSGFNNLQKRSSDVSSKSYIGGTNLVQQNSNTKHLLPNTQLIPNKECDQGRKKLRLLSKKLSLKSELPEMDRTSDEGYKPPKFSQNDRNSNELPLSVPVPKSQTMGLGFADSQKDANQGNCSVKQNATPMENIVVSDSEGSADECERPSRSRLSLMRRRLAEKLKS